MRSNANKSKFTVFILLELALAASLLGLWGCKTLTKHTSSPADQPAKIEAPSATPATTPAKTSARIPAKTPPALRAAALPAMVSPRIVIEKSKFRLTLYDGAQVVKVYSVAIGANDGHKQREGDRRTPEGTFRVCVRNPRSKYILSLGLSYPGVADAKRGLAARQITQKQHDAIVYAIRKGKRPPWNTPLGGEIMIHGCRRDAAGNPRKTLGCIAMEDDHIKELYPKIPLGTAVTIKP
jgi:murein L,D-transpeptidase YafK